MSAPNTRNVAAANPNDTGGVYWAPLGTALPTDATTALAGTYIPLGFISDAGVTPSRDSSIDKPKAWGGKTVAALETDKSKSYEWTMIEPFSADVQKFVHGTANVTVTAPTGGVGTKLAVIDKGTKPGNCVLVFEMKFGAKKRRIVVPVGDHVVTGEAPYTDSELSGYTITTEALDDVSGNRTYEYLVNDDGS